MANESSLLAQPSGCAGLLIGAIHLILPLPNCQHHICSSLQILIIVGLQIHFRSIQCINLLFEFIAGLSRPTS